MRDSVIQLLTAFSGSLGFSVLFRLRRSLLFPSALGGMLSFLVYLLAGYFLRLNHFQACLLGAAFSELYSELLARCMKTPSTLFFVPAVIPLIPGSALYYAMNAVIHGRTEEAAFYGGRTGLDMLAIAIGMSLVSAAFYMERAFIQRVGSSRQSGTGELRRERTAGVYPGTDRKRVFRKRKRSERTGRRVFGVWQKV